MPQVLEYAYITSVTRALGKILRRDPATFEGLRSKNICTTQELLVGVYYLTQENTPEDIFTNTPQHQQS